MSKLKKSQLREDLGDLLKNTYKPQKEAKANVAKKGYGYDDQLSTMNTKVYVSPTGKPIIAHRGTTTVKDVIDDGLLALGLEKYGFRYKNAKRITEKAEKKYGQSADAIGHSLGGSLAEKSGAHGNVLTFNKGVGLGDIFTKKNSARQLDISTRGDLVSGLGKTQNANKEVIDNRFKSKDFFKNSINAHGTDNLFNNQHTAEPTNIYFPESEDK